MNRAVLGRLSAAALQALEQTTEAVKSDIVISAVVPKQTGELERSVSVDTSQIKMGKTAIKFDTPYARRLYWHPEYDFRKDKNANARGKWMQTYIDGEKREFARKAFKRLYLRAARGVVE